MGDVDVDEGRLGEGRQGEGGKKNQAINGGNKMKSPQIFIFNFTQNKKVNLNYYLCFNEKNYTKIICRL